MTFLPNIPQPNTDLSDSQGDLLNNNLALDTSFGIDHYKFSNATANNGFHNKVTTPPYVASPPTGLPPVTVANPVFYSFQDSANLGVIQYSRGPNNAVPSPLTYRQSTSTPVVIAPGGTADVFDFTGLTRAMCALYAMDTVANAINEFSVWWTGAALFVSPFISGSLLASAVAGNILRLKNNTAGAFNNVYWTLQFLRTT